MSGSEYLEDNNIGSSSSSVDEKRAAAVVCVTGAGGFIASWLVKLLLSNHHYTTVRGTLRNPDDEKHKHLKKLDISALNKLQLFKADILDYEALYEAISGCEGVFHVASPVPSSGILDPERQLIEPAVNGTLNVLKASSKAGVKKVVLVSSVGAVTVRPDPPKDWIFDESCWSDTEYCKNTNNWYCFSKTVAESEAWKYAKQTGLNLVTICPSMVFGPMLQSSINFSSWILLSLLNGEAKNVEDQPIFRMICDVQDVAEALLLVYNKSEAEGRYLCCAHHIRTRELVRKLRQMYPNYDYPEQRISFWLLAI